MTRLPEAQLKRGMDAEGYQLHSVYLTYQAPWLASLELRMRLTLWPDDEEKAYRDVTTNWPSAINSRTYINEHSLLTKL